MNFLQTNLEAIRNARVSRKALKTIKHTDLYRVEKDGMVHLFQKYNVIYIVSEQTFLSIKSQIKNLTSNSILLSQLDRELKYYSQEQYVSNFGLEQYNMMKLASMM
jgi:hypothetical protein